MPSWDFGRGQNDYLKTPGLGHPAGLKGDVLPLSITQPPPPSSSPFALVAVLGWSGWVVPHAQRRTGRAGRHRVRPEHGHGASLPPPPGFRTGDGAIFK